MNRRSFLCLPLAGAVPATWLFPATADPTIYWDNAGGFYREITIAQEERQQNQVVTLFKVSLHPFHPKGNLFRTTVLERLRATRLLESNDPLADFFPVISTQASEGSGQPDALVQIVSIQTPNRIIRIRGSFHFRVDGVLITGPTVSAATWQIAPQSLVSLNLVEGTTGNFV